MENHEILQILRYHTPTMMKGLRFSQRVKQYFPSYNSPSKTHAQYIIRWHQIPLHTKVNVPTHNQFVFNATAVNGNPDCMWIRH